MRAALLGLLMFCLPALAQKAEDHTGVPPIGQRKYVIQKDGSVKIVPLDEEVDGPYLKDPKLSKTQNSAAAKKKAFKKIEKKQLKAANTKTSGAPKKATIKFGSKKVSGDLIQPRVDFSREQLEVGRVDEPVGGDFYRHVFDPASDRDF